MSLFQDVGSIAKIATSKYYCLIQHTLDQTSSRMYSQVPLEVRRNLSDGIILEYGHLIELLGSFLKEHASIVSFNSTTLPPSIYTRTCRRVHQINRFNKVTIIAHHRSNIQVQESGCWDRRESHDHEINANTAFQSTIQAD